MPLIYDIEDHALFKRGFKKGFEQGIQQVIEEKRKGWTINMLRKNMSIEDITDILEVDIDYIVTIQKELNQA